MLRQAPCDEPGMIRVCGGGPMRTRAMAVEAARLDAAVRALRKMGATRVLLFGSFAESPETARDIDIAVEGIPLNRILDADVAVHDLLGVPVDLVSREETPEFYSLISRKATVLSE